MQIHELNSFIGTPGAGDYLAIDDGSETTKVEASNLGVTTQMTQAEATEGLATDPRVITPAVFKSSVDALASAVAETVAEIAVETIAETFKVLVVSVASFSSLPKVITNENVTSDMVVVNSILGTPSAQTDDWSVATYDGSLKITGSISGSTTIMLYLMKSR